ncbi:hypothetical protein [Glutamicibacter arilaitensis]|uniref:hypothetical protein n=1 Tax=Glutamicibacter arilaitensis TaxID=256701 RepID=UPI00384C849B
MSSIIRTGYRAGPLGMAALLGAAIFAFSACSSGGPSSGLGLTSGNPRAVVDERSSAAEGLAAGEGAGNLLVGAGGCFALDADDGPPVLLVFPEEAQILADGWPGVKIADEEYLVGDEVVFSGGYRNLASAELEAVTDCQPQEEAFFVHASPGQ